MIKINRQMNTVAIKPMFWGLFDYASRYFSLFSQGDFYEKLYIN